MDVPKKERTINQVKSKSFRAFHKLGILPGFMTHNYDWLTNRVHSQGCRISRQSPNTRHINKQDLQLFITLWT